MGRPRVAAAGKGESVSLSFFMEVNNLEVEEELSTMATLACAEGIWMGRWGRGSRRPGGSRSWKYKHGDR